MTTLSIRMPVLAVATAFTALAAPHAEAADTLNLYAGPKGGVYYAVGQTIAAASDTSRLSIRVIESKGSWDNLGAIANGVCTAGIVQGDALAAFARSNPAEARSIRRAAPLHREYVHAICNRRSGVTNLYDIKDDNKHPVEVGETGSGSWITWQNFVSVNAAYDKVPKQYEGGMVAAGAVADGHGPACMVYVAGLHAGTVNQINDQYGDALALVPATGSVFRSAKDERGDALYEMQDIPAGTYPKLQPSGWVYGTKAVEVPTQRAVLAVNPEVAGENFQLLMDAVGKARSKIRADTGE